jgi:hypothetical protein
MTTLDKQGRREWADPKARDTRAVRPLDYGTRLWDEGYGFVLDVLSITSSGSDQGVVVRVQVQDINRGDISILDFC